MTIKLKDNKIINCDSYKQSHFKFLQDGTTNVYAYMESRIGAKHDAIIFFGLQSFIKEYLLTPVTQEMIDQAETFLAVHGEPFNREGWEYILHEHDGYFPVVIKSADEGSSIPVSCPYLTIENTDKNPLAAWCSTFVETQLMRLWAPIAVATQSNSLRKLILSYLEETGTPESVDFKLVDFGARGVSSKETAEILGAAHLTAFKSTDNLLGIAHSMDYYNESTLTGFSIPASEHSETIMRGEEGELQFYKDTIETFLGPDKMVSVVGDTYSLPNMLDMLGTELKSLLLAKGGTWVVRPDSGDPVEQVSMTVQTLDKYFGHIVNEKGYKVLHPSVRVIQGDGVTYDSIEAILSNIKSLGYSADNVTFGSGGFLLQSPNRDQERTAIKASYVEIGDIKKNIRKAPKTDMSKASKAGRVTTIERDGKKITVLDHEILHTDIECLKIHYKDGKLYNETTFSEIRERSMAI